MTIEFVPVISYILRHTHLTLTPSQRTYNSLVFPSFFFCCSPLDLSAYWSTVLQVPKAKLIDVTTVNALLFVVAFPHCFCRCACTSASRTLRCLLLLLGRHESLHATMLRCSIQHFRCAFVCESKFD